MRTIKLEKGKHNFTLSAKHRLITTVKLRELFKVETLDGFNGTLTSKNDVPSQKVLLPYVNPQTGPIYVEGVEKGDTLIVEIKEIKPLTNSCFTVIFPGFGGLIASAQTRMLNPGVEDHLHEIKFQNGNVIWDDKISFPYEPMIGCIGTAPEIEEVSTVGSSSTGGNMDIPDVCPGNKIYLPVKVDGAYLYLGDVMATQGDGEICGTCGEHSAVSTIVCDVIKGKDIIWPRIESSEYIMTVGSARPLEDAVRIAYCELIEWLHKDYNFDIYEVYMLLSHLGKLRVANLVDTLYTVVAKFPKKYINR